jgi:uncharacterized integral membrane protein
MRVLSWLLRAFIFFTLFAFALNNQHAVDVRWFFGLEWHTRMVFVVLAAFAAGCVVGILAMLPGWWRSRRPPPAPRSDPPASTIAPTQSGDFVAESRLREGL